MKKNTRARTRLAALLSCTIVLVTGAAFADPAAPLDPRDLINPLVAQDKGTWVDPDLGKYGDGVSKREYLMMRDEYVERRRGPLPAGVTNPRLKAALEVKRRLAQVPTIQIGNPNDGWVPYGPDPIPDGSTYERTDPTSGRTIAIVVHPANPLIVYAGTAGGGLYRSLDGGGTWKALFDSEASLAIGALALAPSNPETLYVGTGEPNQSCDSLGGVGWYRIENASTAATVFGPFSPNGALTGRAISRIIPHPTDPDRMLIGVIRGFGGVGCRILEADGALYRAGSINGASPSLTKIELPGSDRSVSDLALPATNTLLVGLQAYDAGNEGILRSTNPWAASPSFTRVYNGNGRVEFGVGGSTASPTIVAGVELSEPPSGGWATEGAVVRSTDNGASWAPLPKAGGFCKPQCWYDMAIGVHPTNANVILLGGSAGEGNPNAAMFRSSDGGATFSTSQAGLHADTHALAFSTSNPDTVFVGNDGGIWRSVNAGTSWVSRNTKGFSATQFVSVAAHPTDGDLVVGGTQDNGTLMRSGGVWDTLEGGDGGAAAIDGGSGGTDDARIYHTFYAKDYKRIFYSRSTSVANAKNGKWEIIGCYNGKAANGIDCSDRILFYPPLELGPGSPNTIYFGSTTLWRSADGGETHTAAGTAPDEISAIAIAPTNDAVRVIGTAAGDVRRTMSGGSLVDVSGPWSNVFISSVALHPTNTDIAYVSLSAYLGEAASQIWKTTNLSSGSPTWTKAAGGMPDVPVNDLIVDPRTPTRVYAATDVGVFSSSDSGASWNPMSGMPIVPVYELAVTRAGTVNQRLRAATHGRGIWERFIGERTPVAQLTPESLAFGKRYIGTTSAVETVTLRNVGNVALKTTTVTLGGSSAFEIVSNSCELRSLHPGMECSIGAVFHANDFSSHSATVTINSNAPGSPHVVGMSGSGGPAPLPAVRLARKLFVWEMLRPGATRTETVQISNPGTAPLTMGTSALVGTDANQFRIASDGCAGASVPPGGACSVRVSFAPTAVGGFTAGLSVPNNAGANAMVSFEAAGQTPEAPVPAALPASVDFGRRVFGQPVVRSVTLQNQGTGPLQVDGASIEEVSEMQPAFGIVSDGCAGVTIMPGRSCVVDVRFTPPYFGGWSGVLQLDADTDVRVPLTGTGDSGPAPAGRAEPPAVSFGTVRVNTESTPRGVRIYNDGTAPMTMSSVRALGGELPPFRVVSEDCSGAAVEPGAYCSVSVVFAPTSGGSKTGVLYAQGEGGVEVGVPLSGEGYVTGTPGIAVSPSAVHFAPQVVSMSSTRTSVIVRNPGSAPLALGLVSIVGDDPGSFQLANDGCSLQVLPAGAACTVGVIFRPNAEGEMMATLAVPSNATATPAAVLLYGSGLTAGVPSAAAYPATMSFASQIVRTTSPYRPVSLTNTGTGDLTVGAAVIDGVAAADFGLVDYCSGRTLSAGEGCLVYASFTPRETGARAATLTLPWNGGQTTIPLTGTGVEAPSHPAVSVTPAALGFGYVKVGAASTAQLVTIRSTGSDPLVIERIDLAGASMDQFSTASDTCTGGTFVPGSQCTVAVRFRPTEAGAHVGSIIVTTNAGQPIVSMTGTADQAGPVSSFDTPDRSIVVRSRERIAGQSLDDFAVDSVTVSYVNVFGGAEQVRATISSCPAAARCVWRADLPTLPGIYTAVATATDKAGNVESPGPRITVVII